MQTRMKDRRKGIYNKRETAIYICTLMLETEILDADVILMSIVKKKTRIYRRSKERLFPYDCVMVNIFVHNLNVTK